MTYYRVKPGYAGFIASNNYSLIDGELYTPYEIKRKGLPEVCFDKIQLSMHKTHKFFGARFENQ